MAGKFGNFSVGAIVAGTLLGNPELACKRGMEMELCDSILTVDLSLELCPLTNELSMLLLLFMCSK